MINSKQFSSLIVAIAIGGAVPALAQSSVSGPNTVTLDATNPFNWTANLAATNGSNLPGTQGTISFQFLSTNVARTQWSFSYTIDNTSVAPSTSSRMGVFGFNSATAIASVVPGTSQRFDAALSGAISAAWAIATSVSFPARTAMARATTVSPSRKRRSRGRSRSISRAAPPGWC